MMKNVLLLALLCLGACSASISHRSLLSLRRRRLATTATAVTTFAEMEAQLKVVQDRITKVKSMPVYYLAVRKTLVESKKCIMTNLALIKTTKVVILASKFFLPIRPFADKADQVLKKTEAALKLQDKITVILSTNRMEGFAKKNLRKVETVKTKMKKVEDYVKKATTAAKKAKKMWELVVKHAPKAGAASQVKADEAATGATNLADPIVDLLKSINANTKNMYANLATVATAVKIAQGPIDVYKSAICKPKEAIQKILNIIKPFVDKLESKKCIPCTCLGGLAE